MRGALGLAPECRASLTHPLSFLSVLLFLFFSEVKERAKKAAVEKKKATKADKKAAAPAAFEKVPKSRRLASKPKATTR